MGDKFCSKSSPNVYYFLGYIEKHNILVKTAVGIVWATFGRIWATFYFTLWSHWTPNPAKVTSKFWSENRKFPELQNVDQSRRRLRRRALPCRRPLRGRQEASNIQRRPAAGSGNLKSFFSLYRCLKQFSAKNTNVVYFTSLFSAYNCFSVTIKCFVLLCSQREKETLKRWRFSHIYIHVLSHQMIVGKISSRKITSKTRTWEKASIASLLLGNCLKPVSGTKKNIFGEIIFCFLVISSFLSFDLLLR